MKKNEKQEKERIITSVTTAYSVYEALEKDKSQIISPEDFLDSYCINKEIFTMLLDSNVDNEQKNYGEKEVKDALEQGYGEAENILKDQNKLENFLDRLSKKLKIIPYAGEKLSKVPTLASMVIAYCKGEYKDVPMGSMIAIVSALLYFVSPVDIIPDSIPVLGYADDAAVIALCWKMVESDVDDYIAWRNGGQNQEEQIEKKVDIQ